MGRIITGFVLGAIITAVAAFISASQIIRTNHVSFCKSCHEMRFFHNTWVTGPHGTHNRGTIRAKCTDCHLPHEGLMKYLITKAKAGMSDFYAHMTKKKASLKEWIAELENTKRPRKVYESGCRECHKELIGSGVPLKAILAHRAYLLRETDKTCVSCHKTAGHGDLIAQLKEKIKQGGEL